MSTSVPEASHNASRESEPIKGRPWFAWMVGMWVVFYILLGTGRLDDIATAVRDLPLVFEILVWLLFLPWMLATAVWTSDWPEWLRVLLIVLFTAGWTIVSVPRRKRA
jgi:4-amino-4-deoxy-L-arabinose transferase-like glycosyltransferase